MTDATPGVIIFVVGIFFVWMTRFRVKHVIEHPRHEPEKDRHQSDNSAENRKQAPETEAQASLTKPSTPSGGRVVLDYHTNPKL
jgi:hypothetical protein